MPSDLQTGSLLRTLVTSKPNGLFLELGTGTGLLYSIVLKQNKPYSIAWMQSDYQSAEPFYVDFLLLTGSLHLNKLDHYQWRTLR